MDTSVLGSILTRAEVVRTGRSTVTAGTRYNNMDHDTISLSRHEQVCLIRLGFERYFSHTSPIIGQCKHYVLHT